MSAVLLIQLLRAAGLTNVIGGVDYRKAKGWIVFRPGETSKEVQVLLIDDDLDDDGETVVVQLTEARLVDPSSSRDYERLLDLEDDKATGTISNADALPRALLARFGRKAAVHVVEHVEERMQAPREPGFTGRFAGRELERDVALNFLSELGGMAGRAASAVTRALPVAGLPGERAGLGVGRDRLRRRRPAADACRRTGARERPVDENGRGGHAGRAGRQRHRRLRLAFKADALWVGTAVDGPAGRMAATEAAASRVRTALEGSRGYVFGSGLLLKPSVEVGLRHDGGDAEQGSGLNVGGGLVVFAPSTGLSADARVRMLLVHEAEGFSERGVSVSASWNPTPSTPLGFTARVGRASRRRGAGAVGPGDDGGHGARRLRAGQPARWRFPQRQSILCSVHVHGRRCRAISARQSTSTGQVWMTTTGRGYISGVTVRGAGQEGDRC